MPGIYGKASKLVGDAELLYKSDERDFPTPSSWSRDGRYILYQSPGKGIWAVSTAQPASGVRKPVRLASGETGPHDARFSPDGRFFSYTARESESEEVFVQRFDPSAASGSADADEKWKVSQGGGRSARWRADGKELIYLAANGNMMAVDVSTSPVFDSGAPRKLFSRRDVPDDWDMTGDGQRFLMPLHVVADTPCTVVLNWASLLPK